MSDDDDFNWGRYRWLIVCIVVFAAALIFSMFDIAFLLFAREGTATVTKTWESTSRRRTTVMAEYTFKEPDGYERTSETSEHWLGSVPVEGEEFEIQYLPRWMLESPDASRPKRSFGWITLGLLLISGTGLGFFTYRAIRPPESATPRSPPSRRR